MHAGVCQPILVGGVVFGATPNKPDPSSQRGACGNLVSAHTHRWHGTVCAGEHVHAATCSPLGDPIEGTSHPSWVPVDVALLSNLLDTEGG
jgi:hypothetical protein